MILVDKKLFFQTASVILEDECIPSVMASNKYSSIVALSYNQLKLPNFKLYSKPTLLIDLSKGLPEILQGFNDTTRNEIRRTEKISELCFTNGSLPNAESYKLYSDFEFSQSRAPVNLQAILSTILFSAYYNNEIISGVYVILSGKYLRIRSIFSKRTNVEDKEIYKIIGYATRRIIWEICKWGKNNGYVSLDMASVNINNPKTLSIAKFKMSFGKELVPEYTYIYKTKVFAFFEKMAVVKILFKKIVHKLFL